MVRRLLNIICIIFILCMQLASFPGCIKEYSYEGGIIDSIPIDDSIPGDTIANTLIFPHCSGCDGKDGYILGAWSFKYDSFFFCGNITRGIIEPEHRMAFTFFGPSACSTDTGVRMTVYLDVPLNGDASYIITHHVILQYYNNKGTQDIFVSDDVRPFSLTIEQYTEATGVLRGSFSGFVNTDKDSVVEIKDGKFEVKFS
jgi:hypothetical protein